MSSMRWLHRSERFGIGDWVCRSDDPRPGPVEASPSHAISITRRGVYRKHVGRVSVVSEPGTATFYRSDREYRASHPAPGGDRCLVLEAGGEWLEGMSEGRARRGTPPWLVRRLSPREILLAHALHQAAVLRASLAVEETLAILLPSLCGDRPPREPAGCRGSTRARHRSAVESVKTLLATRFEEDLSLEEIAREVAYSPTRLCVVFRAHAGTSIHRHRIRLRLIAALERLADCESLTRLAFDLGFSSHSHFTRAFRAEFGLTPSVARERLGRTADPSDLVGHCPR